MTTEGDGNYHLQEFIEQEGGEVDIQIVTNWLLYNIWEIRFDTQQRAMLRGTDGTNRGLKDLGELGVWRRDLTLRAADRAVRAAFFAYSKALGLHGYPLANMHQIAELAAPYYNNDLRGGEGHMEVGKVILNAVNKKSTMTLSVKPFGCMPSSGVSDGVQSFIVEKYPGTIFCAVETSGDGAVNFQSRVQMYLSKAKQSAREELDRALQQHNLTLQSAREYLGAHPTMLSPLYRAPHHARTRVADLVHAIGQRRVPLPARVGQWMRQSKQSLVRSAVKLSEQALHPIARFKGHPGNVSPVVAPEADRTQVTRTSAATAARIAA